VRSLKKWATTKKKETKVTLIMKLLGLFIMEFSNLDPCYSVMILCSTTINVILNMGSWGSQIKSPMHALI
jgi:hypothetical protein